MYPLLRSNLAQSGHHHHHFILVLMISMAEICSSGIKQQSLTHLKYTFLRESRSIEILLFSSLQDTYILNCVAAVHLFIDPRSTWFRDGDENDRICPRSWSALNHRDGPWTVDFVLERIADFAFSVWTIGYIIIMLIFEVIRS
jgi:hypothetical protein